MLAWLRARKYCGASMQKTATSCECYGITHCTEVGVNALFEKCNDASISPLRLIELYRMEIDACAQ